MKSFITDNKSGQHKRVYVEFFFVCACVGFLFCFLFFPLILKPILHCHLPERFFFAEGPSCRRITSFLHYHFLQAFSRFFHGLQKWNGSKESEQQERSNLAAVHHRHTEAWQVLVQYYCDPCKAGHYKEIHHCPAPAFN